MPDERTDSAPGRVTVCIPCFEQSKWLGEALASVAAQTVPALETIVVDDGSNPLEGQRIREISRRFGAQYVRVTNRGLSGARNTALMLASGDAFLPLDADDWIEPEYIEKTLPWLADADVVCVGLREHGLRDNDFMPGYDRPLEQVNLDLERHMNRLYYCSLFRTDLLRSAGGYNGRMVHGYEDWDLTIDLMTRGARYVAVYEILFNYRVRADGMLADAERNHRAWNIAEMSRHHGIGP